MTGALLAACGTSEKKTGGSAKDKGSGKLAVAVYGGPTTKTWTNAFGNPFSKDNSGIQLSISGVPNPSSLLYTQKGNVQFDLLLATASDVAQLAEGDGSQYTPLDPADLKRASHIREGLVRKNKSGKWVGVPVALTYYGIVVNSDKYDVKDVTSWADLADPRYEDQYLMNGAAYFSTTDLPMFALANGGSKTNLEPGFKLLKRTLPNVKSVATSLANAASMLKAGDAGIAPFFFSQYSQLLDSKVPVEMALPNEGAYAGPLFLVLSPNSKNRENAMAFLDSVLLPERQEAVQGPSAYIPVVDDAKLIDKLQTRSGFSSVESLYENMTFPDYAYLAAHREKNTKRIENMLASEK